jgi:hypothetical protein
MQNCSWAFSDFLSLLRKSLSVCWRLAMFLLTGHREMRIFSCRVVSQCHSNFVTIIASHSCQNPSCDLRHVSLAWHGLARVYSDTKKQHGCRGTEAVVWQVVLTRNSFRLQRSLACLVNSLLFAFHFFSLQQFLLSSSALIVATTTAGMITQSFSEQVQL